MKKDVRWEDRGFNCYALVGLSHGISASLSWASGGYRVVVLGRVLKKQPAELSEAQKLAVDALRFWLAEALQDLGEG